MQEIRTTTKTKARLLAAIALYAVATASASAATMTTLATFNFGVGPRAGVTVDAAGNVFGTTFGGGSSDNGTIFRLAAGTHALTTLATFNGVNGSNPQGRLIADAAGNLFGTTVAGGALPGGTGYGTVFRLDAGASQVTKLAVFTISNGTYPSGRLYADAAGNLFGASRAGTLGAGTIFRVSAGTNALTTVVAFDPANTANPNGGLIADASGNLYGTTSGSSDKGTLFRIAAGTNALTTLVSFGGVKGETPSGGLIADASGNLYGTTGLGGANGYGTVFKLATGTNQLTTLASFTSANGARPSGSLIADAAGNLYGTTLGGGANDLGTVFRLAAGTNQLTTLATFDAATGYLPDDGLTVDASGNLYGITTQGALNNHGSVFELTNTGFVVPEPASISLLALGGVMLCRRRAGSANRA